ncbi:hypothetical protein ACFQ1L_30260 [Phytohabitans flavus]|nr:hypothetical protein [Phytohabitans flavus]
MALTGRRGMLGPLLASNPADIAQDLTRWLAHRDYPNRPANTQH